MHGITDSMNAINEVDSPASLEVLIIIVFLLTIMDDGFYRQPGKGRGSIWKAAMYAITGLCARSHQQKRMNQLKFMVEYAARIEHMQSLLFIQSSKFITESGNIMREGSK